MTDIATSHSGEMEVNLKRPRHWSSSIDRPWRDRASRSWRWTSPQSCKVVLSASQSHFCAGLSTAWGRWRRPRHRPSGSQGLHLPSLLRRSSQDTLISHIQKCYLQLQRASFHVRNCEKKLMKMLQLERHHSVSHTEL